MSLRKICQITIFLMARFNFFVLFVSVLSISVVLPVYSDSQIMAIGIDRKFTYDQKSRGYGWLKPGEDEVLFYDLRIPNQPELIGSIKLDNSIIGPPTNIAISPSLDIALISSAIKTQKSDSGVRGWIMKPDNKVSIVDISARPVKVLGSVQVGNMPSGISINNAGTMALVANRKDGSIAILDIDGKTVKLSGAVDVKGVVTSVAFSVDGNMAFAVKHEEHKVAVLDIKAGNVSYRQGQDIPVGLYPWTIAVSQQGTRALVTNIGFKSASDGNNDTVSVIDISENPPRVVRHITVGDAPEGAVFSPNGKFAAVTLLGGSFAVPQDSWYWSEYGQLTLIEFKGVGNPVTSTINVGGFPEGVAFSKDSEYVYTGNFSSNTVSVIKINTNGRPEVVKEIKLSGPPASLRVAYQ